jgi:hypothetical protein
MKGFYLGKSFIFGLLFMSAHSLFGQLGGQSSYAFLELPANARVAALGGHANGVIDMDPSLSWVNPASSNKLKSGGISFSQSYLFEGISQGSFIYNQHVEKWDLNLHGGLRSINYGEFVGRDETGAETTTFEASEVALMVGLGKQLYERLSVGVNLMYINSALESYSSNAIAGDLGLIYHVDEKRKSFAILLKNAGWQLKSFTPGRKSKLPTDLQVSFTKRLEHLPFRFSVLYHHLNRWDINYYDPNLEPEITILGGEEDQREPNLNFDNFLRHFSFNGEMLIGEKEGLRLQFGYNHMRQKEMQLIGWSSLNGVSLGVEMKLKRFRFGYSRGRYHIAGSSNQISISTNINRFGKNRLTRN